MWTDFRAILTRMVPAQFAILNNAEAQEIAWLRNLGSSSLQAVIATVKAANVPAPVANRVSHE